MSDVDRTLARGVYRDRRGREWVKCPHPMCDHWVGTNDILSATRDQMRRIIERDRHRDVCPGLRTCYSHPVPNVVCVRRFMGDPEWGWGYVAYQGIYVDGDLRVPTLPEAIDAAIELAKEEA